MRFISKISGYKVAAVHEETEQLANGKVNVLSPGYMVEFTHGGLTDWEREFAKTVFQWRGLPTAIDGSYLDPVNDLHRVGAFDTDTIDDPTLRKKVEEALLSRPGLGVDYVVAEAAKLTAPWPAYDKLTVAGRRTIEMVAEKIAGKVAEDGYDPADVIAYERQNLDRAEVIAALEALLASEPEPDDELVAA